MGHNPRLSRVHDGPQRVQGRHQGAALEAGHEVGHKPRQDRRAPLFRNDPAERCCLAPKDDLLVLKTGNDVAAVQGHNAALPMFSHVPERPQRRATNLHCLVLEAAHDGGAVLDHERRHARLHDQAAHGLQGLGPLAHLLALHLLGELAHNLLLLCLQLLLRHGTGSGAPVVEQGGSLRPRHAQQRGGGCASEEGGAAGRSRRAVRR
mmetsp:Transcript_17218/g.54057  ORF Transcript_17218/g.54057 Transcript_17218/m.54057 type:complete len:207 (+) Transcript_17218:631-1251(+)